MNGGQDLGGMMGFGPISPESNEPVFHSRWEGRAFALNTAAGILGLFNLDMTRYSRESLPPAEYLSKSYYDIWISGLVRLLLDKHIISMAELSSAKSIDPSRANVAPLDADRVADAFGKRSDYTRSASTPARYAVGDVVRTKVMNPVTHTRLPRYARGKMGIIEAVIGCHVFPDSNAHGKGEDPNWCYTVVFDGKELWGEDSDPSLTVSINAWEPYLEHPGGGGRC